MTSGHVLRFWIAALAAVLALSPAAGAQDAGLTEGQRRLIDEQVREFILKHPEVIVEAIRRWQAEQEAEQLEAKAEQEAEQREQIAQLQAEIERNPADPVLGNPHGDVTLVEFFDYQCGYCKQMTGPLFEAADADGNLRLVMKEFPILGQVSVIAARAALASREQDAYEAMHIALMNLRGRLTEETIFQTARELGLDVDRLVRDMESPEIDRVIQTVHQLAETLGIRGTPAFIVGGDLVPGAMEPSELYGLITAARNRG